MNAFFSGIDEYDIDARYVDENTISFAGEVNLSGETVDHRGFNGDTLDVTLSGIATKDEGRWKLGKVDVETVTNPFWLEPIGED